ncbi:MAG TPA: TetR/AcrR family transcriptional regulator C-terminal domain-containing protein, partial [Candidatus Limnocylindrales bacterium]
LERFVAMFRDGGFEGRLLALANQTVLNYATGFAAFESRGVSGPITEGRTTEELQALAGSMIGSLPPDRFPTLVSIAADLGSMTDDESFEFGLARLLDGLEISLERRRQPKAPAVADEASSRR